MTHERPTQVFTCRSARKAVSGTQAETLCALYLFLKGWDILARRFRPRRGTGAGEIDLIVAKGRVLAFVEIKARANPETLAWAVTEHQRQRIQAGAAVWLALHPPAPDAEIRFDMMTIGHKETPAGRPDQRIFWLQDAWRLDDSAIWT